MNPTHAGRAYAFLKGVDAERKLVERMRQGDETALRALYEALGRNVFALALQMVGSREDAEEVVQDTFVKAHEHAARFDPARGSVRAWVYTIARNACRMRLRARSSRPEPAIGREPEDAAPESGRTSEVARVDRLTVQEAFASMSHDEARLLEDAFYGGYSHADLAERDGVALGTVKSRLRRAMLKARDALTGAAGEGGT
jgi:RNA polymerase sigma-70 factor (ECF subfamily)